MMHKLHLPAYEENKCRLFALGRNAMYAALQIAGMKQGDEVLTPAFDCDGALQPFRVTGLKISFYRSDPYTFEADLVDMEARITDRTKLIHIVNHFGMPQPWEELLLLGRKREIPILEDCAYSLFSAIGNGEFGSFGDLAVFSLRKNLNVLHGGMLRINNPRYSFSCTSGKGKLFYPGECRGVVAILKRQLACYIPESLRRFRGPPHYGLKFPPPLCSEGNGHPDWFLRDRIGEEFSCDYMRPISQLALWQLGRLSAEELSGLARQKRAVYQRLADGLGLIRGLKILWPVIPEGIVPFCLSVQISSKRDAFLDILSRRYTCFMAWPTLSSLVLQRLSEFPDVEILGKRLLQICFPVEKSAMATFARDTERLVEDVRKLALSCL